MKKLLLALLLLIPSLCFAEDVQLARLSPAMIGGGVPAAACSGTIGDEIHDSNVSAGDWIECGKFQNTTGCNVSSVTKITAYIDAETTSTAAKLAVYADNAGAVGSLLYYTNEFDPSAYSTGWHEFTSLNGSGTINNNSYVWLCRWNDGSVYWGRSTTGGTHAYYNYDYSTNSGIWPANGSSFATDGDDIFEIHIDGSGS